MSKTRRNLIGHFRLKKLGNFKHTASPSTTVNPFSTLVYTVRFLRDTQTEPVESAKMDLNSIKDSVSNLTLYDLKAGVRKVQNGTFLPSASDVLHMLTKCPSQL